MKRFLQTSRLPIRGLACAALLGGPMAGAAHAQAVWWISSLHPSGAQFRGLRCDRHGAVWHRTVRHGVEHGRCVARHKRFVVEPASVVGQLELLDGLRRGR